jgi:hypothetical protein
MSTAPVSSSDPIATPNTPELHALQPTEREQLWRDVECLFMKHFHQPDVEAAQVILSCVAAHRITEYPPSWNMAIAVPGSMKTVILESLDGLPDVHLIDEVTPQTFISGKIDVEGRQRERPASLLHRIGEQGIVISADFSTVLNSDPRNRAQVFSQLRRIYDGRFHREFGSDENLEEREWKGRLTFLAGVTPEVDRHHKVFAALGDRFIRTRWPRAGGAQAAVRAIKQDRRVMVDVRHAIHRLMLPVLSTTQVTAPAFPPDLLDRLANLSEFVVRAKAHVPRDRDDAIDGEAQVESNTRLPQQLAQIGRGWAVLMNRPEVSVEDLKLVRRAAFDSIPPLRRDAIEALLRGVSPYSASRAPDATVARALGELKTIGLVEAPKGKRKDLLGTEQGYVLTENAKALLAAAGEEAESRVSGNVT